MWRRSMLIREIYKLFFEQNSVRKGAFSMEILINYKTVYQKPRDKDNDNVICYADSELVLCH